MLPFMWAWDWGKIGCLTWGLIKSWNTVKQKLYLILRRAHILYDINLCWNDPVTVTIKPASYPDCREMWAGVFSPSVLINSPDRSKLTKPKGHFYTRLPPPPKVVNSIDYFAHIPAKTASASHRYACYLKKYPLDDDTAICVSPSRLAH